MIMPEKSSSASIRPVYRIIEKKWLPLLSASHIAKVASLEEKMFSNSVRLIAKLSQILLKPPCSSRILARLKLIKGQFVLSSPVPLAA